MLEVRERVADEMKTYKVQLEPIEDGWWMASIPSVQGCRTQAKSLVLARRRIQDALSLFVEDADTAKFTFEMKLPADIERSLEEFRQESAALQAAQMRAKRAASKAVKLASAIHLPRREVADLLGMSFQRVDQISKEPRRASPSRR